MKKISFECGSPLELMRHSCYIMPWTAVCLQRGYEQLVENNDVDCSERSVKKKKKIEEPPAMSPMLKTCSAWSQRKEVIPLPLMQLLFIYSAFVFVDFFKFFLENFSSW